MNRLAFYSVTAAIAIALFWLISICGIYQIDGYDMGPTIDTAWRWHNGETPGVDFPCAFPVGFILGSKFALAIWGTRWLAFVKTAAWFSALTFAWSVLLMERLFGSKSAILLWAFMLQAMTMLPFSYWSYNPMTTVLDAVYVLAAMVLAKEPRARQSISYTAALTLIAMAKPNTAWVLILTVSICLFLKYKFWLWNLMAFLVFNEIISDSGISLRALFHSYTSVGGRLFNFHRWLGMWSYNSKWEIACATIGTLAVAIAAGWTLLKLPQFIPACLILAGAFGYITNVDEWQDLALILFGCFLANATTRQALNPKDAHEN
jgi:hypothetical protein